MRQLGISLVITGLALAALIGCKQLPPPTPLNQLNAQQTHGYTVFQQTCRQCHSDRVSQPLNGPSLHGVFKKQYLPSGAPANNDRISATVIGGYGIMPAMGGNLSQQDLNDLLAYLHTL
jgi:mono/diheme cytochrome c family protein